MHVGLALVVLAVLLTVTLIVVGSSLVASRALRRGRRSLLRAGTTLEGSQRDVEARLRTVRAEAAAGNDAVVRLQAALERFDEVAPIATARLREDRGKIDEAIEARVLPLLRWLVRARTIARLLTLQRRVFG